MKKSERVIRLETECAARQSECDRLRECLGTVMSGDAVLVGQFTLDGTTVKVRLIGAGRAHGGIVLVGTTTGKGDRPMHTAYYLESYYADIRRSLGQSDYVRELFGLLDKATRKGYEIRNHAGHVERKRYELGCDECVKDARSSARVATVKDAAAAELRERNQ